MDEPLPPAVEERLARLARKSKQAEGLAQILRTKYLKAPDEDARKRVESSIDVLLRPSSGRWLLALLIGLPALVFGAMKWSDHRHALAVAGGDRMVAKVVRLDEGFCWFGTKTSECVEISVEVPRTSGPDLRATINHDLPERYLSRVQPGSLVYVSVSRDDPDVVLLDEDALAEAAPSAQKVGAPGRPQ